MSSAWASIRAIFFLATMWVFPHHRIRRNSSQIGATKCLCSFSVRNIAQVEVNIRGLFRHGLSDKLLWNAGSREALFGFILASTLALLWASVKTNCSLPEKPAFAMKIMSCLFVVGLPARKQTCLFVLAINSSFNGSSQDEDMLLEKENHNVESK